MMPKTEEHLIKTDECYVLLPGSSGGLHHPLMQLLFGELVDRQCSVLSLEYPYQTHGGKPSNDLVEECEALKEVLNYLAQQGYDKYRIIGKSIGGRIAMTYFSQTHDSRVLSIDNFGFTMLADDTENNIMSSAKEVLRIVIQGELDEFGTPGDVRDYLDTINCKAQVLTIIDGDHSYRHHGSRELPTYEKDAVKQYFDSPLVYS